MKPEKARGDGRIRAERKPTARNPLGDTEEEYSRTMSDGPSPEVRGCTTSSPTFMSPVARSGPGAGRSSPHGRRLRSRRTFGLAPGRSGALSERDWNFRLQRMIPR